MMRLHVLTAHLPENLQTVVKPVKHVWCYPGLGNGGLSGLRGGGTMDAKALHNRLALFVAARAPT